MAENNFSKVMLENDILMRAAVVAGPFLELKLQLKIQLITSAEVQI